MDTVDFRGALLRGWRLLLLLTVLGGVVGFILPSGGSAKSGHASTWEASTVIAPAAGRGHLSLGSLFLDIKNPDVLALAAKSVNEPEALVAGQVSVTNAKNILGLKKQKLGLKAVAITAIQSTSAGAVTLVNAVAKSLNTYIDNNAKVSYAYLTAANKATVASLEKQLNSVVSQLSSGTTGGEGAVLDARKKQLSSALNTAVRTQVQLELTGPNPPSYRVLVPAIAAIPVVLGKKSGVAAVAGHRSTKILGAAFAGFLIAMAIIVLVEVADRTLRSVRAAEASFDLPVVAEIPLRSGVGKSLNGRSRPPRLDVVLEPTSIVAEAYRLLQTAVLLEPLAADMSALNAGGYGGFSGGGHENGNGNGNGNGHGNGHGAGALPPYPETKVRTKRQVVLVVSPGLEPSRSPLVANLAAVYGESGASTLVVSIGNLAWRRSRSVPGPELPTDGSFGPDDIVPRTTQSQVRGVSGLRFDQLLQTRSQVVAQGPSIIEAAREVADVVIVEGPPLLAAHDAIALLPAVDVVLLVAEFAFTKIDQAKEAGDLLRRFRAPVLGVALTNVPRRGDEFIRIGVDELDERPAVALAGPPPMAGFRT